MKSYVKKKQIFSPLKNYSNCFSAFTKIQYRNYSKQGVAVYAVTEHTPSRGEPNTAQPLRVDTCSSDGNLRASDMRCTFTGV